MPEGKFYALFKKAGVTLLCGCLLTVFFFPLHLSAETPLRFRHITVDQGLSQNTVTCILQDSRGFLWFGTPDGLNRYDGYNIVIHQQDPDSPHSLSDNRVQAICEDHLGTLWVGTSNGLNRYDREKNRFTPYKAGPAPGGLTAGDVLSLRCDSEGVLWIGVRNGGLNRLDRDRKTFTHFKQLPAGSHTPVHNTIRVIYEDKSGALWMGTDNRGLLRFHRSTETFVSYTHDPDNPAGLSNGRVTAIHEDKAGNLWVGTAHGLNRFDRKTETFTHFNTAAPSPGGLSHNYVNAIHEDPLTHTLWVGAYGGGLNHRDPGSGQFIHSRSVPGHAGSLNNDYIYTIFQDRSGMLWIGTDGGVNTCDRKKKKFTRRGVNPGDPLSLINQQVWSIFKDRGGILWIGTDSGLTRMDRENGVTTQYPAQQNSTAEDRVFSVYEDRAGALWVGTDGNGLKRYRKPYDSFESYRHNPDIPDSLSDDIVFAIREDPSGALWVGTRKGLNRLDRQTGRFTRWRRDPADPDNPANISDDFVTAILVDHNGVPWIATRNGLNRWDRETETFRHWKHRENTPNSLSHSYVFYLHETGAGTLWIGTTEGLNRFDRKTETFQRYFTKHGLPNNKIYGILEDKNGRLWLSTNRGLSRFDPKKETFRNYDTHDGLQGNEFNGHSCFQGADGELFFGGANGFNSFYPSAVRNNPYVPPIVITAFYVMNQPATVGEHSLLKQAITETNILEIPYTRPVFSFDFAALDFTNPAKNRYAYTLEGFDEQWITTGAERRHATYTNLDPGEYVFRVIGSNNDGVWNRTGASIRVVIVPPFWKTWWFRLFLLIGFALLSYVVINFMRNYVILSGFWKREKYVGHYRLQERIGSGGMGTVYKARDSRMKSGAVAIKILREELFGDEINRKRFKREAAIVDQLEHPHIIRVIERGQYRNKLYIVMELLNGRTLSRRLKDEPLPDLDWIRDIMLQVCDALNLIHEHHFVHRDLKPENVMLIDKDGRSDYVKLLDFGLARVQNEAALMTQAGMVLGTLNYMAPEQIANGKFSYASDVYSLGVMLYEMVTSQVPYPGEHTSDVMKQIMDREPVHPDRLRNNLPEAWNLLILSMMAKNPKLRPPLEEVMEMLESFEKSRG